MNIRHLLFILLFLFLLIDSTVFSFPFVFIVSVYLILLFKKRRIFIAVFFVTLVLDSLRLMPIGITGVAVFLTSFLMSFYSRQLHAADIFFLSVIIFAASVVYSRFANYPLSPLFFTVVFVLVLGLFFIIYSSRGVIGERSLG